MFRSYRPAATWTSLSSILAYRCLTGCKLKLPIVVHRGAMRTNNLSTWEKGVFLSIDDAHSRISCHSFNCQASDRVGVCTAIENRHLRINTVNIQQLAIRRDDSNSSFFLRNFDGLTRLAPEHAHFEA